MDVGHCAIAEVGSEVAKFRTAADKRRYNVFFYMSCRPSRRLGRTLSPASAMVRNDAAKLQHFSDIARKKFHYNVFYVTYLLWRRRCQTMVVSIADGTPASHFNGWNDDMVVLSACL